MVITLENGAWYYDLFYQITVIVSFVLFMAIGIRKKYPLHHWALIYLSTVIFASIGVRLMTFDVSEWTVFLQHFQLPETAGKTSLGAILGVVIGVFFAQKALGTKYRALDAFGFLIPVVMILQRLGCTSAGCCFGKPVSNGLGIAYTEQYPIHSYHSITGVIESGADISAFVHPVQLYMVFSQVIIGIVLILLRNKLKQSGSIFLLAVSFTTLTRFWIEFFRDPATNHQLGGEFLGLKIIQWVLIGITAISFTVLVWNERRAIQLAQRRC